MSYFQRPASGTSLTTPISVAEGGTGETDTVNAMITLSSPAFQVSAVAPDWGVTPVQPSMAPDGVANQIAINELITVLQTLGVIV